MRKSSQTGFFEKNLENIQQNEIPECCKPENVMISLLTHQEQHYGWISVALHDDLTIDEQETGPFRQIANDLGFALHSIATQRERDEAASNLHETNKKLVMRSEEIPLLSR